MDGIVNTVTIANIAASKLSVGLSYDISWTTVSRWEFKALAALKFSPTELHAREFTMLSF